MHEAALFLVLTLATFRAWRLLGRDDLTAKPRGKLPSWLAAPVSCPWCAPVWLAAAAVFTVDRWFQPLALPVLWWGAVAAVCGFLGEIDRKLDD